MQRSLYVAAWLYLQIFPLLWKFFLDETYNIFLFKDMEFFKKKKVKFKKFVFYLPKYFM